MGHDTLPADAIVQMEPILRGRAHWSLIPTFAERRMIAGLPISLLPTPDYHERSARVQRVFQTSDAREAAQLARELGIGYLYSIPTIGPRILRALPSWMDSRLILKRPTMRMACRSIAFGNGQPFR